MKIDALVAEIGSTTTLINGFAGLDSSDPVFVGQGVHPTTVLEGDVTIGLEGAMKDLANRLGVASIEAKDTFACSSAAGGLRMTVHGLVHDMTVKAAKEAALGAGANLKLVTAGLLDEDQIQAIKAIKPNIIMIAGGVDYGETQTSLANAKQLAAIKLNIPIIYAGNIQNQTKIRHLFEEQGQASQLIIIDNVYPKIDTLQVEKARQVIQAVFEEHITKAPGMEKVRSLIKEAILPTPGAVMEAAILLQKEIGDILAFDVGGATTDVHSVTAGNPKITEKLIAPEPFAKRTVEGDLGVFINCTHIVDSIGRDRLSKELEISVLMLENWIKELKPIPDPIHHSLVKRLTLEALIVGCKRHAGHLIFQYGANGKITLAEGKDLTAIKTIIGTGGALTRLPDSQGLIRIGLEKIDESFLKPGNATKIQIDTDYLMATAGVLSKKYPLAAIALLKKSLKAR
ncbi:MAG: DNA mismatch repair protein MutL [Acholeplasmataceae bacterium]|nr:DNA mismatch repair protein MutL [Acholeplasmataceae bacterium]